MNLTIRACLNAAVKIAADLAAIALLTFIGSIGVLAALGVTP